MSERLTRGMQKLDEVLHGPEPEAPPPPQPFHRFGEFRPNAPAPSPPDDLYFHMGGGIGSRTEDLREAQRVQVELQAADTRRRAREAEAEQDRVRQRIAELERRLAELEGRGEQS